MRGLAIWVLFHLNLSLLPTSLTHRTDDQLWDDPEEFRPERWLQHPDAPIFTYGLGYRMCAGSLLANRELYLVFIRMLNSLEIQKFDDVDVHPVRGNVDPTSLVSMPHRYNARFVPRAGPALEKVLREFKVVEGGYS
jgi:3-hydroxyphenylacetate 6-hydroxylase